MTDKNIKEYINSETGKIRINAFVLALCEYRLFAVIRKPWDGRKVVFSVFEAWKTGGFTQFNYMFSQLGFKTDKTGSNIIVYGGGMNLIENAIYCALCKIQAAGLHPEIEALNISNNIEIL